VIVAGVWIFIKYGRQPMLPEGIMESAQMAQAHGHHKQSFILSLYWGKFAAIMASHAAS
jgi:cytochrome bd-type quinol oxidase subunit 1